MNIFTNQTLASTNMDSQGERLSKAFLERCCARMNGSRFPVHQQHDMRQPVAGYIENVRLEKDAENLGEWRLVGDVFVDSGSVSDVIGGFSVSGVEMIHVSDRPTAMIYIPFPHYNDSELLSELTNDPNLNVGKWIKKSADSTAWVIVGSVLAFAITPIWDDFYKRKIAPRLDALFTQLLPLLRRKGLNAELAQIVLFKGEEVEVRIIPLQGKEDVCFNSTEVQRGLALVVNFLTTERKAEIVGVSRVVIFFDAGLAGYKLHRIEYLDGTVEHVA